MAGGDQDYSSGGMKSLGQAIQEALDYRPPEVEKLAHFLKVFDALKAHDDQQYGPGAPPRQPDPIVGEVLIWLRSLANV